MSELHERDPGGQRARTSEFLARLAALQVRVLEEGGELKIRAPKGALTPDLQRELKERKAEIVALLQTQRESAASTAPTADEPLVSLPRDGELPLSFTQQRLWFLDQLEPEILTYNMWLAVTLRGPLNVNALERALTEVGRRHEVLRTTFPTVEGVPQLVIGAEDSLSLEVLGEEWGPAQDWRIDPLRRTLVARLKEPFVLGQGPLMRAALARRTDLEHVLFIVVHHIVFDGVSKAVFFRELTTLYAAYAAGDESPLPELPIQYADYAGWQKERFEGPELERQLNYWRGVLGGAPLPLLELPTDRPRPAVQTHSGAAERIHVPAQVVDALTELGKPTGATLFVVMLAAYEVFLRRYTGQEDVVVGTAMANRTRPELEELIGFFVNTLALRTDLSGDPSFRELILRTRDTFLGALEHQDMPFQRLVDELQPERSLSHTPIFQTMFVLDEDSGDERVFGDLKIEEFELDISVARTDLVATAYNGRDGFWLWFEYNTDLFDRATIERMLAHFGALLEALAADPELPISQFTLLGKLERQRLLEGWNATSAEIDERTVHARFEAQVATTPSAVALVASENDEALTYAELDQRANRLAHHLIESGVAPGELVGLCLERTPDLLVSMLAINKAGAAYVPLDPSFPTERLAYMVADSGLSRAVTSSACSDVLPASTPRTVLEDERDAISARASASPEVAVGAGERMYVIYTSGSTGRPKGVEIEHRSVSNFLSSMAGEPGLHAGETLLAVTTPSFDISVLELFLPLVLGGTVLLADKETTADGERLVALIERRAPDVLQATPATWRMLLLAGWTGSRKLRALCGGEALPRELAEELLPMCGELWNVYGPTEATIWSTVSRVESGAGPVSIGRPIANTRVYVLDHAHQPVPIGVAGELWIGGDGLARGYLERAELTGERFVDDPHAPGGRMYVTGDLARWRANGTLECLGRTDHQVKLRGFRIELEEIEAVLSEEPGVDQCVTVIREDRLVAFWVQGEGPEPTTEALRTRAATALPAYMVPASFARLDELPLTPNRKVDRRALLALEAGTPTTVEYVAPRNDAEHRVTEVFRQVLRSERVGVFDDFFALGGNSLLSTQALARLRASFEVDLPLRALFEAPTPAGLAERIAAAAPAVDTTIGRVTRDEPLALSFTQQRLWFLDQLEPGKSVYNLWMAWTLRGPLDVDAFERATLEIFRRHDVLRTHFAATDGIPVQVVAGVEAVRLEREMAPEGMTGDTWRRAVHAQLAEAVLEPFDLSAGPLVRPLLAQVTNDEHVFCLSAHHAVFDGWSMGRLRQELTVLYEAFLRGADSPLAEPQIQYADYAAWQRDKLESDEHADEVAWWRETLTGAPLLELPTDRPRPAAQSYRGANAGRGIPAHVIDALEKLGAREGATPFMVLLAALNVLLSRYSGQSDISVGSAVAGREHKQLEELMGYFANTLVLRTDLGGNPTFRELLERVRAACLGAYDHQDTPFEQLVDELQPSRDLSYTPLFQALFVLDDSLEASNRLGELVIDPFEVENKVARTDLTLWARRDRGGLGLTFEYATDLFDRDTIERMLSNFEVLLESIVAAPDTRLSQLGLLTADERDCVVSGWNDTRAPYPGEAISDQFEARVDEDPRAIALVIPGETPGAGGEKFSYAALDERANRLAHHLELSGVAPGSLVGLCLDRSAEMVVAQLAIQKAGAAYVPLDPGFPAERLAYMVANSGLRLVVTHSALRALLGEISAGVVCVDTEAAAIAEHSTERLGLTIPPDQRAYVIYTSGSTGRPKGVEIEHRSVSNFLTSMRREPGFARGDRLLAVTTLSFDISVLETMLPLTTGGTVIVASKDAASDGEQLSALIDAYLPHILQATPATWRMLILSGWMGSPGLRIFCGGEALPRELADELLERGKEVWNLYGPTEATIWSTVARVGPDDGPISIGRPIASTAVYVLDTERQPVPIGVPGELYIGGDGLARGYLERPDLTHAAFFNSPFQQDARIYRTGDLARWRRDGTLECLGRVDNQVKLRGFRIELGEIESVLSEAPGVHQCVTLLREDRPGDARLVAFYVAEQDAVEVDELRAHAAAALPAYMIPSGFVAIDALPLTPNGKVDRRALAGFDAGAPTAVAEYVAPRTQLEERVAEILGEVLGIERVGVHHDFFELGGNSLLTTQAIARLRSTLGIDLPLRTMFEAPTVAGLAQRARSAQPSRANDLSPARRDAGPLPLSFAQQRLWFLDQLEPGNAVYNVWMAWTLRGAFDERAFARALAEVVRRHEVLRTHFTEVEGVPAQEIAGVDAIQIERLDNDAKLDAGAWRQAVRAELEASVREPFDLARGPLLRPTLARLSDDEHVFCLCAHHTIFDGWSGGRLRHELAQLYEANVAGKPSPLAEPTLQYADYAVWQREQLDGASQARELAWWLDSIGGLPVLELPTDRPRPKAQSYRGENESRALSQATMDALDELAAREGCTPFMALLAAFEVLLHRYSGQDDFGVGSVVAGRSHRQLEELMGYFANTLVLRADLSGAPSFRELLGRVRENALGVYDHQDTPFEQLVDELQPSRDLSYTPLFQALFVLDDSLEPSDRMGALTIEPFGVDNSSARTDVTLWARRHAGGLHATLEFATDLFDPETAARMLEHLERTIESATREPDRAVTELALLTDDERTQLVCGWNDTSADYPAETLHVQFEAQADRTPDATAIVFPSLGSGADDSLSYRDLDHAANRLARYLRSRGVVAGALVGLCLERSLDMVIGQLAILKAGAAYVPLDPGFPVERLTYMVADAGLELIVTADALAPHFASTAAHAIRLDAHWDDVRQMVIDRLDESARPDDRAYVIYTSGSTGRPKGVEIEHRSVSNFLASMRREPGFSAGDTLLAVTTLSFDISVLETLLPLTSGGTLVVAPKEATTDAEVLAALIDATGPDVMQATPATWRMLLLSGWKGRADGLRIFCGGEALPRELADQLLPAGRELWNLYGPTEATIWSSVARVDEGTGPVSIGHPIANTQMYVLDDRHEPLPVGLPGELWIAGDGLARGYLGRAELTAERFLVDPFVSEPSDSSLGARMYRTGDLARWHADGSLECLGRIDNQIKLRGFRIELGEIEEVVGDAEGVSQCVTVVHAERPGDERLIAYVVVEDGIELDLAALKTSAATRLPAYMVPTAIVALDAFPLTPNGKIDRLTLAQLDAATPETATEFVAPRNGAEETIAAIWCEVLGLDSVGVHHDFFELGGNSLLTTQTMARVRAAFAVELPLRVLFETPTVAALAELVGDAGPARDEGIQPVPRDGEPLPLSFTQQRLWFLDQLEPGNAVYNVWMALTLRGALDRGAFERAVAEIIGRHEILRTHFSEVDGVPAQEINPPDSIPLDYEESPDGLSEDEWRSAVQRRMAERVEYPFELSRGPLFRTALTRVTAEEHVFCLSAHHTVFDGWSMGRFRQELIALYEAFAAGAESPLAALPLQYADYAAWQRDFFQGEAFEEQIRWWREQLTGASVLELPTDRPRPAEQSYRGANATRNMPAELMNSVEELGSREGATLFMTLVAALDVLLHRYGGQTDVSVGSVVAGRARRELEELMGYFANTLVLRTDLSGDPSFRELLARVRETALGAYDHQDTPFEQLVAELQPARDMSFTPLFQALFVLDDSRAPAGEMGSLEVEDFEVANKVARTDVTLWARRHADGLAATFEYATDLFDAATVERMLVHLETLLAAIVADPDRPISSLSMLTETERAELLAGRDATATDYSAEPVHAQVEAQVDRTPDAVAVTFPDAAGVVGAGASLTYRELDERANRLAHHLRARGVQPGELVGLCLDRSLEMIVAQLAIQKAGAAYVPLDPAFPPERLVYMIRDSGLGFVLTRSDLENMIHGAETERILIDRAADEIAAESAVRLDLQLEPDARMYVIYTSGSTGRPKGVELEHRSVSNFLASMAREPGLSAGETLLAVTTLSFDISVLETMLPLTVGASVAVASSEIAADGEQLRSLLEGLAPSVMQATPATWRMLILTGWTGAPSLRIFCGGEALPRELADDLLPLGRELWNLYGPTETTIWSTVARVEREAGPVSIGHPIANTQVYVLDGAGEMTPVGVPGELWIGGDGLARGYLERPELTAEKFVPDPFAGAPGARMYSTGDMARWRRDGRLECLGRIDNQVKLRGFRIELGEIDSVLAEDEAVHQAVALVREDTPGDQRLVAYYVTEGESEADTTALRARAREKLPAYMVPTAYVELDELPLTPNGKVDRRALLALEQVSASSGTDFVAPDSLMEIALAEIWVELLGLDRVGTYDNFFDLGGHSLLSVQVTARVRDRLGVRITPRDLMLQNLGQLAAVCEERIERDASRSAARHGPGQRLVEALTNIFQRRRN
jgi:amino acid adenylation domain-containing protein